MECGWRRRSRIGVDWASYSIGVGADVEIRMGIGRKACESDAGDRKPAEKP